MNERQYLILQYALSFFIANMEDPDVMEDMIEKGIEQSEVQDLFDDISEFNTGPKTIEECTCPGVACSIHGLPNGSSSGGW